MPRCSPPSAPSTGPAAARPDLPIPRGPAPAHPAAAVPPEHPIAGAVERVGIGPGAVSPVLASTHSCAAARRSRAMRRTRERLGSRIAETADTTSSSVSASRSRFSDRRCVGTDHLSASADKSVRSPRGDGSRSAMHRLASTPSVTACATSLAHARLTRGLPRTHRRPGVVHDPGQANRCPSERERWRCETPVRPEQRGTCRMRPPTSPTGSTRWPTRGCCRPPWPRVSALGSSSGASRTAAGPRWASAGGVDGAEEAAGIRSRCRRRTPRPPRPRWTLAGPSSPCPGSPRRGRPDRRPCCAAPRGQ